MFAGLQAAEHFDEIAVAPAELDRAPRRALAALVDHEQPVATGIVEESAIGDQHRPARIAQRQFRLHGLAALDRRRLGPIEYQVDLKLAAPNLRINLRDFEAIGLAIGLDRSGLPRCHPAEIEFIDVRDQLAASRTVDLAEPRAALKRLTKLDRKAAELPGYRRTELKLAEAAASDRQALIERGGGGAQLGELARLERFIFSDALLEDRQPPLLIFQVILGIIKRLFGDITLGRQRALQVIHPL